MIEGLIKQLIKLSQFSIDLHLNWMQNNDI